MKNCVLVTGGAGFIGSHLVDRLLADGRAVVCVDNFDDFYPVPIKLANLRPHRANPSFRLYESDITDREALRRVFDENSFTHIVHLAARAGIRPSLIDPLAYVRTNVVGTANLLELAKEFRVPRMIFGSSSSVYGVREESPFNEEMRIDRPISPYAATKAAGEQMCFTYSHLYGIGTVCLRFFTVYGPRQRPDLAIHKFSKLIREGKPITMYGDGGMKRDFTYVDDIVQGVTAALKYEATRFEIINLGESRTVRLDDLIGLIERALGRKAVIERQPVPPGDVPLTCADIGKARTLLGYDPSTPIEKGIVEFVRWFEDQERTGVS